MNVYATFYLQQLLFLLNLPSRHPSLAGSRSKRSSRSRRRRRKRCRSWPPSWSGPSFRRRWLERWLCHLPDKNIVFSYKRLQSYVWQKPTYCLLILPQAKLALLLLAPDSTPLTTWLLYYPLKNTSWEFYQWHKVSPLFNRGEKIF